MSDQPMEVHHSYCLDRQEAVEARLRGEKPTCICGTDRGSEPMTHPVEKPWHDGMTLVEHPDGTRCWHRIDAARSATPSSEEELREALAEDAALLHHYVHPDVSFEECDGARCVRRRAALAATPDNASRSPIDVIGHGPYSDEDVALHRQRLARLRSAGLGYDTGDAVDDRWIATLDRLDAARSATPSSEEDERIAAALASTERAATPARSDAGDGLDVERLAATEPWLADIVRCAEAAFAKWEAAHRNEANDSTTFIGADGPFYEAIRSVVSRLRYFHFVTRLAKDPTDEPEGIVQRAHVACSHCWCGEHHEEGR